MSLLNAVHASSGIVVPLMVKDARADEIAVISHELRNSLGVVRNAARLLRMPAGADGVERARLLIERHVGQMNRHVQDLLDASQKMPGAKASCGRTWTCARSWGMRSTPSRLISPAADTA